MKNRTIALFSILLALAVCLPAVPATPPPPAAGPDTAAAAADSTAVVLWPEAQRAFFQDGPQLLLSYDQRAALAHLEAPARQRWIDDFLAHPPGGAAAAGLRDGIALRQRLAGHDFVSPTDVRAQLLFLNGPPNKRTILDCGTTFKPIEVWTYGDATGAKSEAEADARTRSMLIFRPSDDEPFRAWTPDDGKRTLYTSLMEDWLEQWELAHGVFTGERFDKRLCKQAPLIDRVTGTQGLSGARRAKAKTEEDTARHAYGRRPGGAGEGLLDPPADLARWTREAAATKVEPAPAPLAVPRIDLDFPSRSGQRIVARAVASVMATGRIATDAPATEAATATPTDNAGGKAVPATATAAAAAIATADAAAAAPAKPQVGLTVEGAIENDGQLFETFRLRFRQPEPAAGQPVTIEIDRSLRPHRECVLRLKIHDDGSGAETVVARGFVVPAEAAPRLQIAGNVGTPGAPAQGVPATTTQQRASAAPAPTLIAADTVTLVPPEDDVVFGHFHTKALITGNRIAKVVFSVDDKPQFTRHTQPFEVDLQLSRLPVETVVRADGYDVRGRLLASDRVVLNQPHGGLAVAIESPARGVHLTAGRAHAAASITVPSERRIEEVEFRVNNTVVAKLTQPPWETDVDVPKEGDNVFLTVAARLDDGSRAEDVRFLRAQYVEDVAVNLVELFTTVVDGSGQLVHNLAADDFQVLENNQPQTVAKFALVENLPLTLGILIDTSGSMASSLGEAQRAAGGFLERMVRPGDRCFALTFSDLPVVRMPLTDDPKAAAESIANLQADGSTSIHDALVHSLYYYRGTHGQRAMVLLSDGDDNTSQLTYEEAFEYARHSGVAIYTIGLNIPVREIGIRGKLKRLSEATGGKVFFVSKATELVGIYGEIEHELRSRYLLAYQSTTQAAAGGYRQVEVKMKKGNLHARTARGYYP